MKNIIKVILFFTIIIVLQIILSDFVHFSAVKYLSIFLTMSVIVFSLIIFLENRSPTQTVAWFAVFASVPFLGFVFYLMMGRNYRKERMFRKKYLADMQSYAMLERNALHTQALSERLYSEKKNLMKLSQKIGSNPITFASHTEVLTNGEITFAEIKEAILHAKKHIHLEYYIVRNDRLGKEIKDILIQKVKEGVTVRFLIDDVGSWLLAMSYFKELIAGGVQAVSFNPVKMPFLNSKLNFRNHRKIVVIDGEVGFVGGLNIGDEYLGRDKYFGFWRDTHLKIEGEAVRTLQLIFLQDWLYMTQEKDIQLMDFMPEIMEPKSEEGGVQIIAGGPDNRFSVIKDMFFSMITSARETIWIASPYFIPDEDILSGLKIAALSGVDVRLVVPSKPDKKIVFHASRSYFPGLLENGVKIFEYEKGFMHSKIVIVDGEVASIGTANMDMRSFHLNFEVNAFLYKTESIAHLQRDFIEDIENAKQLSREKFAERSILLKMFESLCRLVSPFL